MKTIYLAGGCFWGTEAFMKLIKGVIDTEAGYANGITESPTYKEVCTGDSGHAETVKVEYDDQAVSLEKLLIEYLKTINPVSLNRQGADYGTQYRTGIYYTDEGDLDTINAFISGVALLYKEPVAIEVLPLSDFYPAEDYHQDYLDKNPRGHCHVDLTKAGVND